MSPAPSSEHGRRAQRGLTLLEALVALFLTAVLGLGLGFAAMNVAGAQKTLNAQNLTLGKMRAMLASAPLCAGANASAAQLHDLTASQSITIQYQCTVQSVTVQAQGVAGTVTASTTVPALTASSGTLLGPGTLRVEP
ncbi:PulJ/GspJ family protein [Crenobacter luteus]|uniref:Prepilin-type N-terminal cleavage/methylation domain-containing protein n=1 Tax=Crenobacter luteus TaxID=1452487 RepID=A0A161SDW4_9NEIS|nr:prepilin-type N-terminal cleavage/methylation domain-containing protein [Crenobacter luteus]KZE34583.1 hypothetical protein AVW16_06060 [Crenobacter luteus]